MLSTNQQQQFSDTVIRRFLLAQLSVREQSAFEAALLSSSRLEHRVRLAELELVDAYAADRLRPRDCTAFHEKFLVTNSRHKQLAVSHAFRNSLAVDVAPPPVFIWPRLAWRVAFAIIALVVLFASALVIRREPQFVKRLIPKRFQKPVAAATPTPSAAHHSTESSEPAAHREESPSLPEHEAAPQIIVLRPGVATDSAPVLRITQNGSDVVRLELMLEASESATFSIVVRSSSGEVVHNVPQMHVEADRIDFDVLADRLQPGDFQVTLTRLTGEAGVAVTYHFRVQ
jgi:hypothetical protein